MNSSYNGQYGIKVNATGNMSVFNTSNITRGDIDGNYTFVVQAYSNLSIKDSFISYSGITNVRNYQGLEINTSNVYISNTTLEESYSGILLYSYANYSTIYANRIYPVLNMSLNLQSSNYNNISYNNMSTTVDNADALSLSASNNNSIIGNFINTSGITASSIVLSSQSYNNIIRGNTIITTGSQGHPVQVESDNNTITNNYINPRGPNAYALYVTGSYVQVLNNILNGTGQVGIGTARALFCQSISEVIVRGNQISAWGPGIVSNGCDYMMITNNSIITYQATSYAINLDSNSEGTNITSNNITTIGSNAHAIYVEGTTSGTIAEYNNISTNVSDTAALYLTSNVDNNTFNYNTITNTGYAIYLANSGSDTPDYNAFSNNAIFNCTTTVRGCITVIGATNTRFYNTYLNISQSYGISLNNSNHTLFVDMIVNGTTGADVYSTGTANNTFINASYTNTTMAGDNALIKIWYVEANVTNQTSAVASATVTWYNNTDHTNIGSATTGSDGYTDRQNITQYIQASDSSFTNYNNYTFNASIDAAWTTRHVFRNVTENLVRGDGKAINIGVAKIAHAPTTPQLFVINSTALLMNWSHNTNGYEYEVFEYVSYFNTTTLSGTSLGQVVATTINISNLTSDERKYYRIASRYLNVTNYSEVILGKQIYTLDRLTARTTINWISLPFNNSNFTRARDFLDFMPVNVTQIAYYNSSRQAWYYCNNYLCPDDEPETDGGAYNFYVGGGRALQITLNDSTTEPLNWTFTGRIKDATNFSIYRKTSGLGLNLMDALNPNGRICTASQTFRYPEEIDFATLYNYQENSSVCGNAGSIDSAAMFNAATQEASFCTDIFGFMFCVPDSITMDASQGALFSYRANATFCQNNTGAVAC